MIKEGCVQAHHPSLDHVHGRVVGPVLGEIILAVMESHTQRAYDHVVGLVLQFLDDAFGERGVRHHDVIIVRTDEFRFGERAEQPSRIAHKVIRRLDVEIDWREIFTDIPFEVSIVP